MHRQRAICPRCMRASAWRWTTCRCSPNRLRWRRCARSRSASLSRTSQEHTAMNPRLGVRTYVLAAELLAGPVIVYAILSNGPLRSRPVGTGAGHFYIVSAVAFVALLLAMEVLWAARTLPDARLVLLGAGFLAMAGIFLAHGLGTAPFLGGHVHPPAGETAAAVDTAADPYAAFVAHSHEYTSAAISADAVWRGEVVGFSGRLSLLVSALLFALATVEPPEQLAHRLTRVRWWLVGAVVLLVGGYIPTAVLMPRAFTWIPMTSQLLSWCVALITWAALAFAGWRFLQAYRLAILPLQGTMAFGMALLCEATWFQLRGAVWSLPWWEYHVVMLAGFLLPVLALLWQYRVAGDLGAVVEGLFLRAQVLGLRHGDPRALTALAAAVSAKDTETGEHTERVGDLVVAMGRYLGLPEERLDLLRWAGRLHDLGKIGVPNSILRKPGKLTESEYAIMKLHSPRGGNIALRSRMLAEAAPIIRAHHERMDGSGYPDGLRGDEIPFEARIVAVADVWDALTSDRPYRKAMPIEQATAIVRAEAGPSLDPRCVEALFAVLERRAVNAA